MTRLELLTPADPAPTLPGPAAGAYPWRRGDRLSLTPGVPDA